MTEENKNIVAPEENKADDAKVDAPKEDKEAKDVEAKDKGQDVTSKSTEAVRVATAPPSSEEVERVIKVSRVSKVVKGGKNFSFSAMVVSGDGKGRVGIGLGKSNEVVEAIKKGVQQAKKSYIKVSMDGDTIPHEVIGEFKSSRVLLKPAGPGTGVIAGGPVRALCDAAGIKNILTKSLGSRNAANVVKATIDGFEKLRLKRRGQ